MESITTFSGTIPLLTEAEEADGGSCWLGEVAVLIARWVSWLEYGEEEAEEEAFDEVEAKARGDEPADNLPEDKDGYADAPCVGEEPGEV